MKYYIVHYFSHWYNKNMTVMVTEIEKQMFYANEDVLYEGDYQSCVDFVDKLCDTISSGQLGYRNTDNRIKPQTT